MISYHILILMMIINHDNHRYTEIKMIYQISTNLIGQT